MTGPGVRGAALGFFPWISGLLLVLVVVGFAPTFFARRSPAASGAGDAVREVLARGARQLTARLGRCRAGPSGLE